MSQRDNLGAALAQSPVHGIGVGQCHGEDGTLCPAGFRSRLGQAVIRRLLGSKVQERHKGIPKASAGTENTGVSSPARRTRKGSVPNRRAPSAIAALVLMSAFAAGRK